MKMENLKCFGGQQRAAVARDAERPPLQMWRAAAVGFLMRSKQTCTHCTYSLPIKMDLTVKRNTSIQSKKNPLKANDGRENAPIRHLKTGSCEELTAGDDQP